jgi:hypothetical protein
VGAVKIYVAVVEAALKKKKKGRVKLLIKPSILRFSEFHPVFLSF